MTHENFREMSAIDKRKVIAKISHLYQSSPVAFEEINKLLKFADEVNYFDNVDFFPPTPLLEKELSE